MIHGQTMTGAQTIIRQARRRLAAAAALTWGGRGAAFGAFAGIALVVADRRSGLGLDLAQHAALPVAGMLAGAVLGAFRGRWADRAGVAVHLDRVLRLKDRLGTAEAIAAGLGGQDPLAQLVLHDADRSVAGIDIRPVTPLRLTRAWAAAVPLAAAWALCVAFLPAATDSDDAGPGDETQQVADAARDILDEVDETIAPLETASLDEGVRDDLDTLDRLAEQLASPGSAEEVAEARDQSAAKLDSLADRLAAESQHNLDEFDRTARRFSQIAPPAETPTRPSAAPPPDQPGELEQFTDALRQGSLEEAADAFERLMEAQKSLPPERRRDVAEDLRDLAKQLDQPGAPDEALEQQRREIQKAIDELDRTGEETPRDDAATAEKAEQLDLERERLQTEQSRREAAQERAQRSAEALNRAADEIEKPPEKPPTAPPEEQRRTDDSGAKKGEPTDLRESGANEGERKSLPESFSQPNKPPSMSELLRNIEKLRREGLQQRDASEKLREAARQLADTLTPEQKEAMRKQWSGLSQEQKEQIMEQLQELSPPPESGQPPEPGPARAPGSTKGTEDAPPTGAPPADAPQFTGFDDVDLRRGAEADTNIAEWLSPEPVTDPAAVERRSDAVRRAAAAAERAVERSAVPSRYHRLIQRYFGKLPDPAAANPPPAAGTERP